VSDSSQNKDANRLQELVRQNTRRLMDEALKSGGQISQTDLDNLNRLERLHEIQVASTPTTARARWPIPVLLGVTLVVISMLLFARRAETDIELDLLLSGVTFKVSEKQQVLTNLMNLSSLGIAGHEEVRFPRVGKREAQTYRESEGTPPHLKLTAAGDSKKKGTITLAAIAVPAETEVSLETSYAPKEFLLTINGTPLKISVDVNGTVGVLIGGKLSEQLDFISPDSIELLSGSSSRDINVDLGFSELPHQAFTSQFLATDLDFSRVDQLITDERSIIQPASTVLSGALYFESLGGQEMRLRPSETLKFEWSRGYIRTLALQDGQIAFAFHGTVRGMSIGANKRSLMPTYFEWLRAQHSLSFLWGTTLYVLGLIISVLTWWKGSK